MSDNNERLYLTILSMPLTMSIYDCDYGCRCRRKQICCGLVRAFTSLLFMSCDVSCLVNGNAGFIHL